MIKLLALCGSLRKASLNAMLLRAMQRIAPDDITIDIYPSLGNLPLFNPDIEHTDPGSVIALRDSIIGADGLIIASPEYARGVSGVMKNALDWMVGNESFVNKPVMLLNASPRAHHALDSLRLTLQTMSAVVVDEAYVAVQVLGAKLVEDDIVNNAEMGNTVISALQAFKSVINSQRLA